jgi:putative endonuclease
MTQYSFVYILANQKNGTLYIGVTSDLIKRVSEHKAEIYDGFSKKYKTHMLVYHETHEDITSAIMREKQLKKWNRKWKLKLIEENNPDWKDLYEELF